MAIEPSEVSPDALQYLIQRLSVEERPVSTTSVARLLRERGYHFKAEGSYATLVRAWLKANPCFFEVQRGYWALGFKPSPRELTAA